MRGSQKKISRDAIGDTIKAMNFGIVKSNAHYLQRCKEKGILKLVQHKIYEITKHSSIARDQHRLSLLESRESERFELSQRQEGDKRRVNQAKPRQNQAESQIISAAGKQLCNIAAGQALRTCMT